ncbi:MAG: alpha/beta fold hydrolase [Rhodospirillales bacterium]|jgi:phospholipase/carboxylesterase|nr:alpha/beta fold hydrolase [Rhodospirillales bacterium]
MTAGFPDGTVRAGAPLADAAGAVVLLHGRGAGADDMLGLAEALARPDLAFLAPQAPGCTWYPYSFLAPLADNEPALGQALARVDATVAQLGRQGFSPERVVLLGFSQGACLALEYAARHARRYGGVVALSGGLIGPEGTIRDNDGWLAGTPVFIGCGDRDGHIPLWRVRESTDVLRGQGAEVTERIYPGMGHTVNDDEIGRVKTLLAGLPLGD